MRATRRARRATELKLAGYGGQRPENRVKSITEPTEKEVDDHCRTHVPHRNWCPKHVKAKRRDLDHKRDVDNERGLSEKSYDCSTPAEELASSHDSQ